MSEDDINRKIETAPLEPPNWSSPVEEEAWTEEYFQKQDCGTVVGEPPTYQWVISLHQFNGHITDPIFTFCKEGYAKLYKQWLEKLNPTSTFFITKVINNPPKPKELQNV